MTRQRPVSLSAPRARAGWAAHRRCRLSISAAVLPVALLLGGCQGQREETPPSRAPHPTIVSLNPCSDAVLTEVAAPGQLLAISHYSQDPAATSMDLAEARRYATTTGSVEEIAALSPDVVVAGAYLDPATAQALASLHIKVVTLPIAATLAEAEGQVRTLSGLVGNPAAGEEMLAQINQALRQARPPAGARPLPALIWESGGIVAGDDTLIADLMRHSGFINAAAAHGLSQASYLPLERMVADPPPVIFTVGDAVSQDDRLLRHPALDGLAGVTRAPLDGSLLWCGGPTIPRALARLVQVRRQLETAASTSSEPPAMSSSTHSARHPSQGDPPNIRTTAE